jgi:hypothetical protein
MGVQTLNTPANMAVTPANMAVPTAKNDILIDQEYSQEFIQKKLTTENQPPVSSSFFSQTQVSELLRLKLLSDPRTDDKFLEHCKHHIVIQIGKNELSLYQRLHGLQIILKGLIETGEHFKATGFESNVENLITKSPEEIRETNQERWKRERMENEYLTKK